VADQCASARTLLEQGDFDGAEFIYRQMLQRSAEDPDALYGLGLVCYSRRNLGDAEHWFRQSLQRRPESQQALYYLGEIAALKGDKSSAISLFARILVLNPAHSGALDRLSRLALASNAGQAAKTAPASGPQTVTPRRPPRPPSSQDSIVGIARHIQNRVVPYRGRAAAHQLLSFRVEIIDQNGMIIGAIGIELHDFDIRGTVDEGDWVEITERPKDGGRIKSFMNLSTGTLVKGTWRG
jgi:tetratricopeptide (TPR) repeat protein